MLKALVILGLTAALATPACDTPCRASTCGAIAALGFNCSDVPLGCECAGCCAGSASSTEDTHMRRDLAESECPLLNLEHLAPSFDFPSIDLVATPFNVTNFFERDGGLLALAAPVLRGPGDWLGDLVVGALRDTTGLSRVDNSIQGTISRALRYLLGAVAWLLCCCGRASVSADEQRQRDEAEEAQIKALGAPRERVPGVTIGECLDGMRARNVSWESTLAKSGRSQCGGAIEALMRLLFWHLLQAAIYLTALSIYWDDLGFWQRLFGALVGVREVMYMAGSLALVVFQPSFLLVDVVASFSEKGGPAAVIVYVLAPEKMVFAALAASPKIASDNLGLIGVLGPFIFDVCAVGALVAALHSGVTPPALMVGYSMTALAGLSLPLAWYHFREV